ncbi:MAG TPA: zf-HC2 domain-containing protein [Gemmatimonadaceae bacterium]
MTSSNMTCEAFDTALPDYLEGALDDSRRASVERHLSECVRCTSLLRDIENISKQAAALPDMVPSRDLWQGIEARIAAPVIPLAARPERQRRVVPAWMGVAAAALVVSTAGITYTLTARSFGSAPTGSIGPIVPRDTQPQPNTGETPSRVIGGAGTQTVPATNSAKTAVPDRPLPPVSLVKATAADREHSDQVYGREINMLQNIVSQRRTQLDSSTVAIIEKNLKIIDRAIEQSRAALAKDPASRMLDQQLTHALDKKVELLRTAAMLPANT